MKINPNDLAKAKAQAIEVCLRDLTAKFAEQPCLIVIGGFAIKTYGAERFSQDGDIMVDFRTLGELRDQFILHKNPRLGKEQFLLSTGAEVDVYVENQHRFRVPFDEIQAYATRRDDLWVACPEHLLVLKLDAAKDRRHTDKGDKDIEDILLLLTKATFENKQLLKDHLSSDLWGLLDEIVSTPGNWQKYAKNNYKVAAEMQAQGQALLNTLKPGDDIT